MRAIELNPLARLHYVQVRQPDMHDPSGDLRRLTDALEREWGLTDLICDLGVLHTLQPVLRAGGWQVTVAVHAGREIIAVWPGLHERAFGIAVDIGSTTIAAHLCDLQGGEVIASAGLMNPQIRFGEDLMSRVSYSMMNPGGAAQMTSAVQSALSELAADIGAGERARLGRVVVHREGGAVGEPRPPHMPRGVPFERLNRNPGAQVDSGVAMHFSRDLADHSAQCPYQGGVTALGDTLEEIGIPRKS